MKQSIKELNLALSALTQDGVCRANLSANRTAAPPPPDTMDAERGRRGDIVARDNLTRDQVVSLISRTVSDNERRKRNVIVTGLPEHTPEDDIRAFSSLCEQYMSTKPVIASLGAKRLGKVTAGSGRHRRLLVHLESDDAASAILRAARQLRSADDPYVASSIYINPDLSAEDQRLAFERRTQRRARGSVERAASGVVDATPPLPTDTQHFQHGQVETHADIWPALGAAGGGGPSGYMVTSDHNSVHLAASQPMAHLSRTFHKPIPQFSPSPAPHQVVNRPVQSHCAQSSSAVHNHLIPGTSYQPQPEHGMTSMATGHSYILNNQPQLSSASYAQCLQNTNAPALSFIYPAAAQSTQAHEHTPSQTLTNKIQQDYLLHPHPFLAASHLSSSGHHPTYSTGSVCVSR